jgi:predicted amidohydrolase
MPTTVKIAGVQMDVAIGDLEANLSRIESSLEETARQGAQITVFPECVVTGYCFESLDEARPFAETIPGPSVERIAATCRKLNVFTVFGMLEADGSDMFNACVLVGPDGLVGSYRKVHLPCLGIDQFTTPGDRPFEVLTAGETRIGMNICYDGAFPESSRIMALDGADLIALPTNWPPGADTFAKYAPNTRAMENNIYYIAVNRVGTERGFRFIGYSKILDTDGNPIDEALHEQEKILYGEIELERARKKCLVRVPGKHQIDRFADRRPELYGRITEPKD